MIVSCPHCRETIEFRSARPKFCAYCGRAMDDAALEVTAGPEGDMPTIDHTPISRERTAPAPGAAAAETIDRIGGYRLIRPLGQGGMGTVYEAEESTFGRRVAVKLLAADITASPEAIDRFRQEGRLASAISHPRCVFVLNADEEEGRPFIVMELMPGLNLYDLVRDKGPLAVDDAVPKILDVIEGLREAHRLGVIHRDVKPSNCFLEADGRVKVGDFGLSKSLATDSNITRTGAFLGTPLYASPEQIKGDPLDRRTDVYSVAATLYYLLAGRAPFQGSDAAATLAKIVSDPPPPLRAIRPELSAELERIILKGLERNRDRRYRDLGEMAAALLPFAPGRLRMGGLGLRLAAYLLDANLAKFVIIFSANTVRYSREGGPGRWADNFVLSAILDLLISSVSFFLVEPLWGASPGKWLLRLRVRGEGTAAAGPAVILKRNFVFWAFSGLPWVALALLLGLSPRGARYDWLILPTRLLGAVIIVATMRESNGYAGLHDRLTGTRVVVLPRMIVRRAAGARRALGKDRVVAARPVGVVKAIGPYRVRGAVRWEENRKVLAAEDSSLGREVWIVLRPRSSPAPEPARRELARATRPRWLSGGEQAEGRWDAFIAPSGCPLSDLAGAEGLPWRDARPILEDLADELCAAARDGTLPEALTVDQVWIQPDGRALLVDQFGIGSGPSSARDPVEEFARARAFLRSACQMALEGGRRKTTGAPTPIRAAVPRHARAILDRLDDGPGAYPTLDDLRADLARTQDQPVEVTRSFRATQLATTSAVLAAPLAVIFGVTAQVLTGWYDTHAVPSPSGTMKLLTPDQARGFAMIVVGVLPCVWPIWAFFARGGFALSLLGLTVTRADGLRASRFRCALRSLVAWVVPTALLLASLQVFGPGAAASPLAWTLFGASLACVIAYPFLAMIEPSRGPVDRVAGTAIVPK